jgi:hypothetical protein
MPIYIIRERRKIQVYEVTPDQEAAFLAEKKRMILASGNSLPEAVAKLKALSEKLDILDELSRE